MRKRMGKVQVFNCDFFKQTREGWKIHLLNKLRCLRGWKYFTPIRLKLRHLDAEHLLSTTPSYCVFSDNADCHRAFKLQNYADGAIIVRILKLKNSHLLLHPPFCLFMSRLMSFKLNLRAIFYICHTSHSKYEVDCSFCSSRVRRWA